MKPFGTSSCAHIRRYAASRDNNAIARCLSLHPLTLSGMDGPFSAYVPPQFQCSATLALLLAKVAIALMM